ncbi:hypothetical protein LEP1GSC125_2113 [Leptospira mayottensis 200901122]|uniref:Secreted protein n=1 Tax=Leptospira mayottensis 200901122 TaxID=1193010 RepID=A0AA87MNP3_9LEPT|nr:hypothetical protein LEP1GSC125_2113 [Leptospira mayottensis 200901122]
MLFFILCLNFSKASFLLAQSFVSSDSVASRANCDLILKLFIRLLLDKNEFFLFFNSKEALYLV